MKILIIRHADPDYAADSLTAKGWKEAQLLSERLSKMDIQYIYVSPLGRARDTAGLTLQKMQKDARICDWLKEFPARIRRPDQEGMSIAWDWLPQDWTKIRAFYNKDDWMNQPLMQEGHAGELYAQVIHAFDALLARHGYVREADCYRVTRSNMDTIALFCHFGLECVLLSRLLGISPMVLWHGLCAAPSSVTTLVSEERRQGTALFRMNSFGDVSHLSAAGDAPSFSARFCECFENADERHD